MSHLYGELEVGGSRVKNVTRCGHKGETMFATVATPAGSLVLRVWHDEETGGDRYVLEQDTVKLQSGSANSSAGIYKQVAAGRVGVDEGAEV